MPGETSNFSSRGSMPEGQNGSETPHIKQAMEYILTYALSSPEGMQELLDTANQIIHAPGHEEEDPHLLRELQMTIVERKVPSRLMAEQFIVEFPAHVGIDAKDRFMEVTRELTQLMLYALVPFVVIASGLNELARIEGLNVKELLGNELTDASSENKDEVVQRIFAKLKKDFRIPLPNAYIQKPIEARWVDRLPVGFDLVVLHAYEPLIREEAPSVLELGIQFLEHIIEQKQANVVFSDAALGDTSLVPVLTPAIILRNLDKNAEQIIDIVDMVITATYLCIRDDRWPDNPLGKDDKESSSPTST